MSLSTKINIAGLYYNRKRVNKSGSIYTSLEVCNQTQRLTYNTGLYDKYRGFQMTGSSTVFSIIWTERINNLGLKDRHRNKQQFVPHTEGKIQGYITNNALTFQ